MLVTTLRVWKVPPTTNVTTATRVYSSILGGKYTESGLAQDEKVGSLNKTTQRASETESLNHPLR
jgi:hypothetical protein